MKDLVTIGLFVLCFSYVAFAETVTIQNGVAGYSGCKDVTIFNGMKAEQYSWFDDAKYFGYFDDHELVNCAFTC